MDSLTNMKKAMFGAGCFWGVEQSFKEVKGVVSTTVGYAGGVMENPTYQDVCTDETGHAEVVLVEFDEKKVSYEDLLKVFWSTHDPTTLNRQGPDVGSQYRSLIGFYDGEQEKLAKESLKEEQKKYTSKIVTLIEAAPKFFKAEEYHQDYLEKTGKVCH